MTDKIKTPKKPTTEERDVLRSAFPRGARVPFERAMDLRVEKRAKTKAGDGDAEDAIDGGADEAIEDDPNAPIPIAISSEAPVLRYDWWDDELYYEVLDHASSSINLDYARDGLPFMSSHRAWDADSQHGIVEQVVAAKDKRLRGDLRMSRAQRSQEIRQDIVDGIRKKVSVGYILGDEYEQTKSKEGEIPTRRYTAWMPIEVSTVPIPADYDVGAGRSASGGAGGEGSGSVLGAALPSVARDLLSRLAKTHPIPRAVQGELLDPANANAAAVDQPNEAQPAKERTVDPKEPAPGGAPNAGSSSVQIVRDNEAEQEQKRITAAKQLGRDHALEEKVPEWIRTGKTEDEIVREVNKVLAERLKNPVQAAAPLDLTKEKRTYSFARAILAQADLDGEGNIDAGFEREITQELRKKMPNSQRSGAMVLPLHFNDRFAEEYAKQQGRAGIDSGTATTGGSFKFTMPGDFLTMLRNRAALLRLGATFLTGLTGPVSFPKQNAAGSASWIGENPGSDTSDSNLTTTTVSLAFKTLMSTTSVSRQALFSAASGNYDLEAIIRSDLALVIALALDLAGIAGSGQSNQPTGLLNDTSIGSVTLGTNGGTVAWGNIVDLETTVGNANGDQLPGLGYLTNPTQRGRMKKVAVLGNTASGVPIWTGGQVGDPDGIVNGYRAVSTKQVPSNLTKGTSTTVCSAIIFGAFSSLMVGQFGNGFEILADPYRLKKQAMIELTAFTFADIARRYSDAFAAIQDSL